MLKFDLFKEWLPSILDGSKPYLYNNVPEDDVTGEDFMLCRALSQYGDCIGVANIANQKLQGKVSSRLLYDFLFYAVPKKKRYSGKWGKQAKEIKEAEAIKKAFSCNDVRAKEYLALMNKKDVERLVKDYTEEGGQGGKRRN